MRYCLILFCLVTFIAGFCGQVPVKWHILATPGSNQQFKQVVSDAIQPGWHRHSQPSEIVRVVGRDVDCDNENIHVKSELVPAQKAYANFIINNSLKIYTGYFNQQEIVIHSLILVCLLEKITAYPPDQEKWPKEKRFHFKGGYIKTVGDKWASFQAENFGSASKYQYVILSPNELLLNQPVKYKGQDKYRFRQQWGIKAFNKTKPTDAVSINGRTIINSKSRS